MKFNKQMLNLIKEDCDDNTLAYIEFLESEVDSLRSMNYNSMLLLLEFIKNAADGSIEAKCAIEDTEEALQEMEDEGWA